MVEVIIALKNEQAEDEGAVDIDGSDEDVEKVVKKTRRRKKKEACDRHQKRACADCTNRCARIHGRRFSSSSSKARPIPAVPSFFKVMMGYFSESMEIPPPFGKTIMDLAGSNIYLEDSFGLRWRVRLCLRGGALSFGHGWKNFVLDHAVSCGEFLVFRQIARSVFTVQVFAPSAVERLCLCEKNQRQNRKRKTKMKKTASSAGTQTGKEIIENNGESCKKKRRTSDHQHDQVPTDCKMSALVCIADPDVPDSAPDLKYSETSEKALEAGAAESHKESNAQTGIEDICTVSFTQHLICDAAETENPQGSSLPAHVDASAPSAVMDLNEGGIADLYLSADMYDFDNDICNLETFPVDLNEEELITHGQCSGFSCLEDDLPNQHSSMEVGEGVVMSEVVPCSENNQVVDALETCQGAANVPAHDIDINVLPAKEPSSFEGDNSAPPTDAEVPVSECALGSCNRDKCSCNDTQAAQKKDLLRDQKASRFVPSNSSAMQDKPEDGQVNMQGSTEQHDAEITPSSSKPSELPHLMKETDNNSGDIQSERTEPSGVLALARNSGKFCVTVPPPDQTWLELPTRLPIIPRRKNQGRKVVILKDPCTRLWPVLYQCTPRFSGFIAGWVEMCMKNNLREGDTCEFEVSANNGLSFQVRNSSFCPAT